MPVHTNLVVSRYGRGIIGDFQQTLCSRQRLQRTSLDQRAKMLHRNEAVTGWCKLAVMNELLLYTSPRACSTACHVALEESGLVYRAELVRIRSQENRTPEYLAVNPTGKLPALVTGDEVLTETPAILTFVADRAAPSVSLLPENSLARYRALEWMSFLTSTVHLAFRPLFKPQQFTNNPDRYDAIRARGGEHLRAMLLEVERRLDGRDWALGDDYSVVDPYLLVFHIWSQRDDIRPHVAEMPNWAAQRRRIDARPATWRILEREGITADNVTDP